MSGARRSGAAPRPRPAPGVTIFRLKLVHSIVYWILSACTLYALYGGVTGRITAWTWVAAVRMTRAAGARRPTRARVVTCRPSIAAGRSAARRGVTASHPFHGRGGRHATLRR